MLFKRLLYFTYGKLLEKEVKKGTVPIHIGLILDGNRRYAREKGFNDITMGHTDRRAHV